jgi:hypothetical protein
MTLKAYTSVLDSGIDDVGEILRVKLNFISTKVDGQLQRVASRLEVFIYSC